MQRSLENQVRVGRQQPSSKTAECRRSPGRHFIRLNLDGTLNMQFSSLKPGLTVAIPYYSGLEYLRLAIESLLRQSNSNWNCIVIDDRGGESAEQLVRGFSSEKIIYLKNETTLGLSSNWNRLIQLTETELLTIFHADDVMGENFINNTLASFANYPEIAASHCRARLIDDKGRSVSSINQIIKNFVRFSFHKDSLKLKGDRGLRSIALANWIICPTLTYRTQILKEIKFNNSLNFACDLELIARLLFADLIIHSRNEYDYSYRTHKGSQTARMKQLDQRFQEEWAVISWIGKTGEQRDWHRTRFVSRFKPILRMHMAFEAFMHLLHSEAKLAMRLLWWAIYKPPTRQIYFVPQTNQKL